MNVFILAAGFATRWNNKIKHLSLIRNEPLICRTVKMLNQRGIKPIVLTPYKEIKNICEGCVESPASCILLNTVLSCANLWYGKENDTCFLMGDTVFTNAALDIILKPLDKNYQFYGSLDEHFAFCFQSSIQKKLCGACAWIINQDLKGTTWELYRCLTGIPLDKDWIDKWFRTLILDGTDDIDYPEDYQNKVDSGFYNKKKFDV